MKEHVSFTVRQDEDIVLGASNVSYSGDLGKLSYGCKVTIYCLVEEEMMQNGQKTGFLAELPAFPHCMLLYACHGSYRRYIPCP